MKNILNIIKNNYNKIIVKIESININIIWFVFLYSLFSLIAFNFKFFNLVYKIDNSILALSISFIVFLCIYNAIFILTFQRKLTKFLSILLLLINASILYFMNTYDAVIDKVMLLNVQETNVGETLELLNTVFISYLFIFAVIPSIFIIKINIIYPTWKKEILYRFISLILSFIIVITTILICYKGLSSTIRQNKRLKHIIIPFNYFDATFGLIQKQIKSNSYTFQDITTDVKYNNVSNKKNLVIFVVGEASRNKNWSLSGYEVNTNKYLEKQDLIYFNNFFSCGTSTAISVPCIFSHLSRKDFDIDMRNAYSNLLDFLKKANFNILWRENNSDCKGVCARIKTDNFTKNKIHKTLCNSRECFDEVMIDDLQNKINNNEFNAENNFIVLHQKGSHGPAYYLRYPENFEEYSPSCDSEYFNKCSNEEIINAYNNTINYTSYFLNKTIEILQQNQKKYNVALIYVSDHGQSLGEKGMYLHGTPYKFAPDEQKHVPFFMWFSNDFKKDFNINTVCLENKKSQELTHDNIFHSVLGLFNIQTQYYKKELDLFSSCRQ